MLICYYFSSVSYSNPVSFRWSSVTSILLKWHSSIINTDSTKEWRWTMENQQPTCHWKSGTVNYQAETSDMDFFQTLALVLRSSTAGIQMGRDYHQLMKSTRWPFLKMAHALLLAETLTLLALNLSLVIIHTDLFAVHSFLTLQIPRLQYRQQPIESSVAAVKSSFKTPSRNYNLNNEMLIYNDCWWPDNLHLLFWILIMEWEPGNETFHVSLKQGNEICFTTEKWWECLRRSSGSD